MPKLLHLGRKRTRTGNAPLPPESAEPEFGCAPKETGPLDRRVLERLIRIQQAPVLDEKKSPPYYRRNRLEAGVSPGRELDREKRLTLLIGYREPRAGLVPIDGIQAPFADELLVSGGDAGLLDHVEAPTRGALNDLGKPGVSEAMIVRGLSRKQDFGRRSLRDLPGNLAGKRTEPARLEGGGTHLPKQRATND